jgi:hypothetical protein
MKSCHLDRKLPAGLPLANLTQRSQRGAKTAKENAIVVEWLDSHEVVH